MSKKERKKLHSKAKKLFKSHRVAYFEYDQLREEYDFFGYAHFYLGECQVDQTDVIMYKQLLEIDAKLGTTQTEQLLQCLLNSVRMDLIKV